MFSMKIFIDLEVYQSRTTLILLILWYIAIQTKANQIYILSTACQFNPTYVQDYRVDINAGNLSVNFTFNVAQDFPLEPWLAIGIDMRGRKTNRYRPLLKFDPTNLCHVMRDMTSNILKMWIEKFLKHGSLLSKCPYVKANYSWHNVGATDLNVPNFISGKYRIYLMTYFKTNSLREMLTNATVYWEMK